MLQQLNDTETCKVIDYEKKGKAAEHGSTVTQITLKRSTLLHAEQESISKSDLIIFSADCGRDVSITDDDRAALTGLYNGLSSRHPSASRHRFEF